MTARRTPAPMLYHLGTSLQWLRALAAAMDEAGAGLCRAHWQGAAAAAAQPVHPAGQRRVADGLRQ